MTADTIAGGRMRLDQSKTSNAVDLPVVAPLREALDAGPLGEVLLLATKDGEAFTPKGFYGMMKRACRMTGLPHCSPHGLRKSASRRCRGAGCTIEQGMAITGHKSEAEYRRYAGADARGALADTVHGKVLANLPRQLNNGTRQPVESEKE